MRSVLITGTSTGIGQATAVTLAARGWRVFATMRNLKKRDLLEQALKEAGVQNGVEIEQLDVNDAVSIRSAVASTLSQTGNKLDAVVHNAGVAAAGALEDVPESELRRVMETNFFGVLELTRALLPTFRAQRGRRLGSTLIIGSEAAYSGQVSGAALFCTGRGFGQARPLHWPARRGRRCPISTIGRERPRCLRDECLRFARRPAFAFLAWDSFHSRRNVGSGRAGRLKESAEGKPWIAAELNSDIANARVIGFELVPETTLYDAAEIAKFMRKHIRGITVIR